MTDQPASTASDAAAQARAAKIAAIPESLRPAFQGLSQGMARMDREIAAATKQRALVYGEIQATLDLAVEQAAATDGIEGDRLLVALGIDVAHKALDERVRALHPYLSGVDTWFVPTWPVLRGDEQPDHLFLGPRLSLIDPDRLEAEQAEPLAAALVEFADRFVATAPVPLPTESPEGAWAFPGMIPVDILAPDCAERYSLAIWYTPDGSRAYLVDEQRGHSGSGDHVVATNTLAEVLATAFKRAAGIQREMRLDDEDGSY